VYVVNADGSRLRRLTRNHAEDYGTPAWSPDGRKIAFVGNRDGNSEVFAMNADGTGIRNLTRNPADDGGRVRHLTKGSSTAVRSGRLTEGRLPSSAVGTATPRSG
jgi:Tol biopolymer transport system component